VLTVVTNGHMDRPRWSVSTCVWCNNEPHLASAAIRPKNEICIVVYDRSPRAWEHQICTTSLSGAATQSSSVVQCEPMNPVITNWRWIFKYVFFTVRVQWDNFAGVWLTVSAWSDVIRTAELYSRAANLRELIILGMNPLSCARHCDWTHICASWFSPPSCG